MATPGWCDDQAERGARGQGGRLVEIESRGEQAVRARPVLDAPRAFPSEHTRFVYLRAGDPGRRSPDLVVHDGTRCEVVVMSGLPATGKDAWLARNRPALPAIALDDLREELDVEPGEGQGSVIAAARDRAREFLRRGEAFAWNATNVSHLLRAGLIDLSSATPPASGWSMSRCPPRARSGATGRGENRSRAPRSSACSSGGRRRVRPRPTR